MFPVVKENLLHIWRCYYTGLLLLLCTIAFASRNSINVYYQEIDNFPVKYIVINMNDPDVVVTPAVASNFPEGLESWDSLLHRFQPDAAINGTYFDMSNGHPVGDIAIEGSLLCRGSISCALCITPSNHVDFFNCFIPHEAAWDGYRSVLCAGPRLLADGELCVTALQEGFHDPRVLGSAARSAIGLCTDGALLLITISKNISLMNLAAVCKKLGAFQAMSLDGGSSSALYAAGRTLTTPGRKLSNLLVVYATNEHFRSVSAQLTHTTTPVLARLTHITPPISLKLDMPPPIRTIVKSVDLPMEFTTLHDCGASVSVPIRILKPNLSVTIHGVTPMTISISDVNRYGWCTLKINRELRAMSTEHTLHYNWDSTLDGNGETTLEISVWSADSDLLAQEVRKVKVDNRLREGEIHTQ